MPRPKCMHNLSRSRCEICNKCPHGRRKNFCYDCGGKSLCMEHRYQKHLCIKCVGSCVCVHKRRRSECPECKPSLLCPCGLKKKSCDICNPGRLCEHGKQKWTCTSCFTEEGGSFAQIRKHTPTPSCRALQAAWRKKVKPAIGPDLGFARFLARKASQIRFLDKWMVACWRGELQIVDIEKPVVIIKPAEDID